jgi:hypothetical protein
VKGIGIRPLSVRILAALLLSALSYFVFDALLSAFLFYDGSRYGDLVMIALTIYFRARYAKMVSDRVMGVGSEKLYMGLLLGGLIYGIPSMFIIDRMNVYSYLGSLLEWLHEPLLSFHAPYALWLALGFLWQAFVLDFPRLMLFIAIEWKLAAQDLI